MIKDYFVSDFIGQRKVRRQLSFYLESYRKIGVFKNCLFIGQKGQGKTLLGRAVAEKIGRPYYEINSETVRSVGQLFEQVFDPLVINREVTLMFDEVHCLNKKIVEFLLSVLQPNVENRNMVRYGGAEIEFDFRKFTFLSATTESQRVFTALKDRLKCITLSDYSTLELQSIIEIGAGNIRLSGEVLDFLSGYVRKNARSAWEMGQEAKRFCAIKNKSSLSLGEAKELIEILNIYESGLSELEVQILASIARSRGASLTRLAAKSGLTMQAQRDLEREMLANDLIDIDQGRRITQEGIAYLKRNNALINS